MSSKLDVLLVDDSAAALAQLEVLVGEIDAVHVVGTASDGACAIGMVARENPDLVLMDVVMPGMDGIGALRVLAESHPEVSVAMVTSVGGSAAMAEEAFRLGAVQVLSKPYDARLLEALIEAELARKCERDPPPGLGSNRREHAG